MLVAIGGCSKEVPRDQLVERQGIYYEVNSQTPFSGRVVSYHENGQLKAKVNYNKDGEQHGPSEYYHENGQLFSRSNWKNNYIHGLNEYYYENGELESKRCYRYDEEVAMSYCEK